MRNHLRRRLIVASATALLVILAGGPGLPASPPAADPEPPGGPAWFELYRKAILHSELEEWSASESFIREAIGLNPRPQRNVRIYGMWHSSYIPYFYLGLAEYRQGRYDDAMKSFAREEESGVIQHDPVAWVRMQKLIASAGGDPPSPPAATAPAASGRTAGSVAAAGAGAGTGAAGADPVIEGLESFFKGDYDRSIASFQEAVKKGREEDLTLHLYLGMAYAGKASADAGRAQIWENLAFMEFRRVHEMDPGYRLSSGIFSEDMMALFERAGEGR